MLSLHQQPTAEVSSHTCGGVGGGDAEGVVTPPLGGSSNSPTDASSREQAPQPVLTSSALKQPIAPIVTSALPTMQNSPQHAPSSLQSSGKKVLQVASVEQQQLPPAPNTGLNKSTKDRFRRLPQTQAKQSSQSQNVSVLNGQSMDMSSDIYKIYIQDSQAAQNRLEMHKTLSLLQIQQISRTASKDKDKQYPSTRQSPHKGFHNSNLASMAHNITQIPMGSVLSQLSMTQQVPSHSLAHKASTTLRKQQNSANQANEIVPPINGTGKINNNAGAKMSLASHALNSKIGASFHSNQRNSNGKPGGAGISAACQQTPSGNSGLGGSNFGILTSANTTQQSNMTFPSNANMAQTSISQQISSSHMANAVASKTATASTKLSSAIESYSGVAAQTASGKPSAYATRHNSGVNLDYAHHGGRHQMAKKKMAQSGGGGAGKGQQFGLGGGARLSLNQGPRSYEVYQRETISPINNAQQSHNMQQISAGDVSGMSDPYLHQNQHIQQQLQHYSASKYSNNNRSGGYGNNKQAFDKSADHSFKFAGNGISPTNGKARKRRAPSGVNKVKLVGDRTIKHAIEQAAIRNEMLSQPALKNVTPSKGMYDSASVTEQLDMLIKQQEMEDDGRWQHQDGGFRQGMVETSKIASAKTSADLINKRPTDSSPSTAQGGPLPNTSQALARQSDELDNFDGGNEAHCSSFQNSENNANARRERDHPAVISSQSAITERQDFYNETPQPSPDPEMIAVSQKGGRVIDYLKSEEFIVACGSRGTSSQGRITRVQMQSQNSQPASGAGGSKKMVQTNHKKTVREKMLLESDTNHLFDSQNSHIIGAVVQHNTDPCQSDQIDKIGGAGNAMNNNNNSNIISPLRSYYRQPVSLTKKQIKRGAGHQNPIASSSLKQSHAKGRQGALGVSKPPIMQTTNHVPLRQQKAMELEQSQAAAGQQRGSELERAFLMLEHLKEVRSKGHSAVTKDQAQAVFDAFGLHSTAPHIFDKQQTRGGEATRALATGGGKMIDELVQIDRIIELLEEVLIRQQEAPGLTTIADAQGGDAQHQNQQQNSFTLDQVGTTDLESHKNVMSAVQSSVGTPKHIKLISGVGHQAGHRGTQVQTFTNATAKNTTATSGNNVFALNNKKQQQPQIDIFIQEEKIHMYHPINKCIRLINQFAIEAFLMQSQAYFMPHQQAQKNGAANQKGGKNGGKAGKGANKFFSSQNYHQFNTTFLAAGNYQQMSPIAANNNCANIDMGVVQQLAKQLQINLPKNGDLRSKAFICHAKEQMLTKLFDTLNKSNAIELNFKRQLFQTYRGFIGRGNNAPLLFQIFKQSRWWWNLYQAPQHDENGKVIMQHGQTSIQLLREDFKEHNFIFTQWKKMMHFSVLKSLKVKQLEAQQTAATPNVDNNLNVQLQPSHSRAISPSNHASPQLFQKDNRKETETAVEQNLSNQWRIYAKMEANYHLSNKFALFFHMSKYYKSIERDPFDVLPLTFHITKGTTDQVYFKFIAVFRKLEDEYNQSLLAQEQAAAAAEEENCGSAQAKEQAEQQEKMTSSHLLICARCVKQGIRSGLGHREAVKPYAVEAAELSLPEFVDKQSKYRKQHTLIDAGPSRRTPARGPILPTNDRQNSQTRKMSLAVKAQSSSTQQTTTCATTAASKANVGLKQTCCKCGLSIEDSTTSHALSNAQSVSSLKRRSSLNQGGCTGIAEEEEASGFKFSKGRFSSQKFDQNQQQMLSHRNHPANKRENSIQPQGSLSRLNRRGVQFEEVAVKTTLTTNEGKQDCGGAAAKTGGFGDYKSSSMSTSDLQLQNSNNNGGKAGNGSYKPANTNAAVSSQEQQTRLPAIRTTKQQMATTAQAVNEQSAAAPTLIGGQAATSPKINMSRQSKFSGPQNLTDKIHQSTLTKTRLKRTPMQESESAKKQRNKKQEKIIPNNIWIVKPGENSNRGNGITVCSTLREIKSILCQSDYDKQKTFIVQKYIERPALYNQRKFDIRCFGMLTLINGKLKGFTYDNGYLRTSSRTFVNDDLSNKLIHLTNDAVQKKSDEYGRFESGNKLTFAEYQHYLDQKHGNLKIDFRSHIFSQIKQIMTDTFRATYKVVSPTRTLQHHTFEIFGFDFMLDEKFKVYLIEVNTNPCLETSCPLLQKIITDMVDSGMKVALDPLYPPPNQQKRMNTQISVIQWQLSFDEDLDAPMIEALQAKVQEGRKLASDAPQGEEDQQEEAVEEDLIQECEDEQEFD